MLTIASEKALEQRKPTIFLTCRVHSGESPAQFILEGLTEKLTNFSELQSRILLDNYVFKIIPNLNPDGVARGSWRHDTHGTDMNRKYLNPSELLQPTILAAKEAILKEKNNLKMLVDIHAHCSKRGCFVYGNLSNEIEKQVDSMLFPKLMSMNCKYFYFDSSHFLSSSEHSTW